MKFGGGWSLCQFQPLSLFCPRRYLNQCGYFFSRHRRCMHLTVNKMYMHQTLSPVNINPTMYHIQIPTSSQDMTHSTSILTTSILYNKEKLTLKLLMKMTRYIDYFVLCTMLTSHLSNLAPTVGGMEHF